MRNLVLLHGALGAASEFEELSKCLEDQFHIHFFDFEGHGKRKTDRPFAMDHFSENLVEYVVKEGLSEPHIFGYSMGGYVALNTVVKYPVAFGDIVTLGTKLKWNPEIAKDEIRKINPEKIEEKAPHFANYLDSLHLDWKDNIQNTAVMMNELGNGAALSAEDFKKVKNKVHLGLGEKDNMVSVQETDEVAGFLPKSFRYDLVDTPHPLPQVNTGTLVAYITECLNY